MTNEEIEKALKDRAYEISYGDHNDKWIVPKDKLSQETLAYIARLKEACESAIQSFTRMETLYKLKCNELENAKAENEDMHGELMSLRAYIDNHEEVWKSNAEAENKRFVDNMKNVLEIEKEQACKDTAKEILDEICKHVGGGWLVEIYRKYGIEVDK